MGAVLCIHLVSWVHPPMGQHYSQDILGPGLPTSRLTPAPRHLGTLSIAHQDPTPITSKLTPALGYPGL